MSETKIKKIQVPYELIINPKVPYHAFYLYVHLKMVCVNNNVNIYVGKLKSENYLNWKTTATLKKYLEWLKENNYIDYDFEDLPRHRPLELNIVPFTKEQMYVQVSVDTIHRIQLCAGETPITKTKDKKKIKKKEDCKEMALKLFYFYIKMYNSDIGKAFPSYSETTLATGINSLYIKAINNVLKKNKILQITVGKWYTQIDEDCFSTRRRERNSYVPLIT